MDSPGLAIGVSSPRANGVQLALEGSTRQGSPGTEARPGHPRETGAGGVVRTPRPGRMGEPFPKAVNGNAVMGRWRMLGCKGVRCVGLGLTA